ncbi:MAG TPA: copper-binding protein [Methylomirabilota bacterium]|nr:copper-binding protein [Methylomirabilota bacterium]
MNHSSGAVRTWASVGISLLVIAAGAWVAWKSFTPEKGTYRTTAVVEELWGKDLVLVKHDPIPALDMDKSMSMAFYVESPEMLSGVKPGDRFQITLKETPGKLLIVKMTRVQ